MAVVNTSTFNFAETVQNMLEKQFLPDVVEVTTEVIPKVAKEAAKRLRSESPKLQGKYAKGWTSTVEKGRLRVGAKVHGKSGTYQLAHLLENSHAKRGGGRTGPGDGQIVHIEPVEKWAIQEAEERIIHELEGRWAL